MSTFQTLPAAHPLGPNLPPEVAWPGLDPPNLLLPVSQGPSVLSPQILSTPKSALTQSLTGDGGCWLAGEAGEG